MRSSPTKANKIVEAAFLLLGIGVVVTIITRYQMPFRLDDVIYMQWAKAHSFWDAFDIQRGEIFLSFRPVMGMTMWLLTHIAGTEQYWIWHLVLAGSFVTAIAFTGLTARLVSKRSSATYVAALWYPLAFLSILNVLFWYADMTYSLEMLFVSMAWYFGLRSIIERRKWMWVIANAIGIFAVFTKEPSLLLIHGVWLGSLFLLRKEFLPAFRRSSGASKALWLNSYLVFLTVSLKMLLTSQATSTRFFHIGSISNEQLSFFVFDRIRYYSDTIVTPLFVGVTVLSFLGLVTSLSYSATTKRMLSVGVCFAFALLFLFSKPLLFAFIIIAFIILGIACRDRLRLLLPFALIALINSGVLLITVMLVKTQIVELTFLLTVLTASGASIAIQWIRTFVISLKKTWQIAGGTIATIAIAIALVALVPKLKAKEQLLTSVKASRTNSNDAIKWMAIELPKDAIVLVAGPNLYGIASADDLTSKDDEYKLYAQPTFLQGFVRIYFDVLDRKDISVGYLEDSTILSRVLDSCRSTGNHYLFLQTGLDVDRFHSTVNNQKPIGKQDILLKQMGNTYQTQIWKLWLK